MKSKTIGRDPSCDLVLEHPAISRLHARIELAENGLVRVHDAISNNGTYLNRNDTWIRTKIVTLCIGDRIRFGDHEVSLEQLTAVFGNRSNARLEAKHFPHRHGNPASRAYTKMMDPENLLHKPKRNPVTGKIEEDRNN